LEPKFGHIEDHFFQFKQIADVGFGIELIFHVSNLFGSPMTDLVDD
jgi:hypothetical protein